MPIPVPEQGQLVDVRKRQYVVAEVTASALPPSPLDGPAPPLQHLVRLTSVTDDRLGEELHVIWELEPGAHVHETLDLPSPRPDGFDDPRRLDAFLNAVRWGATSSADLRALQAPFRSGISIEDYQLDPVVRAIQMPRVNLLIADDVGLGKTIEAGLVIQELIVRHRVRTALVVCPSSLQLQWRDQMRDKFGLDFRVVDTELLRQLRRKRGIHANPWTHFPRLITSIDFLKRERPLRLLREILPRDGESKYPRRFDILVVDEAHGVAPPGRGRYAVDSLRTQAIRTLAPHFEHRLFLTATPHNGYPESFSALLELLDPQRFACGIEAARKQLEAIMVRRLKSEIKRADGVTDRFATRRLLPLEVGYTDAERQIHALLQGYTRSRLDGAQDGAEQVGTRFVLKLLKKRLFSSPAAFRSTLEKHIRHLTGAGDPDGAGEASGTPRRLGAARPSEHILLRRIDQAEEDHGEDDTYEQAIDGAREASEDAWRRLSSEEQAALDAMMQWARKAAGRPDSKAQALIRWLHTHIKPGGPECREGQGGREGQEDQQGQGRLGRRHGQDGQDGQDGHQGQRGQWGRERVIIFTEYRDTQKWLQGLLASEGLAGEDRLMVLYGGMDTDQREAIKAAFQAGPDVSPVRILLATDAASEGIDLQNHCHHLIHCEIPWNPNRLEQRNGRIDRHGQRASEVFVYHFVGEGYQARRGEPAKSPGEPARAPGGGELAGDLEFLMRVAVKVDAIRQDLGKVGPVIVEQVEEAMLGRRKTLDTAVAERDAQSVRRSLKFERNIREQVARMHAQLQETRTDLGLDPESVEWVVRTALELIGQPGLIEATLAGVWPDAGGVRRRCPVFRLPGLRGSWAQCREGLLHPHTKAERPITFDHAVAAGRDDVVLVHINHRLVQMSLRLLRAEVWRRDDRQLNRVAARIVPHGVLEAPALVAHARLLVIGANSHRLHEELIDAGGLIRGERFARLNIGQVRDALAAALSTRPPEAFQSRVAALWPSHQASLEAALAARAKERTEGLRQLLSEREATAKKDIEEILTELKTAIEQELAADAAGIQQLLPQFTSAEREQFERNKASLVARLGAIPAEIEAERRAIGERYREPVARVFPVAVTYLVPERFKDGGM